jgi:hypothetical protein
LLVKALDLLLQARNRQIILAGFTHFCPEAGLEDMKKAGHRAILFEFGRVTAYQASIPNEPNCPFAASNRP